MIITLAILAMLARLRFSTFVLVLIVLPSTFSSIGIVIPVAVLVPIFVLIDPPTWISAKRISAGGTRTTLEGQERTLNLLTDKVSSSAFVYDTVSLFEE